MKKKTVFVIPGYRHRITQKPYRKLAKMLKKEGYSPILISIPWKQTTISENTKLFLNKYKKIHARKKYILGFSFGAMIALLASTKIRTSGLVLCSLSPYFKEDMKKITRIKSPAVTPKRREDFSRLHAKTLAKQIKAGQIRMLYGEKEEKVLINRVLKTYTDISAKNKYLIPIQNTEHNIGDIRYLRTIDQVARQLH
ncbi:MAG: hypothetical protein HYT10_02950 [Candidatus Levybacteria bacterium]|nr:hypothetical protein [Candidatus Levybacteria bacterium]